MGDQIAGPVQEGQGPPGGPCREVPGLVGAVIREGVSEESVNVFSEAFGLEFYIIWGYVDIEFEVTGENAEEIKSLLNGSSLLGGFDGKATCSSPIPSW